MTTDEIAATALFWWWGTSFTIVLTTVAFYIYTEKWPKALTWNHLVGLVIFLPGTLSMLVITFLFVSGMWIHEKLDRPVFE